MLIDPSPVNLLVLLGVGVGAGKGGGGYPASSPRGVRSGGEGLGVAPKMYPVRTRRT
jgi:hypothetical protein